MDLAAELEKVIRQFLVGDLGASDLEAWVADHSLDLDRRGARATRALAARVWRLASEVGYGHRSEDDLRCQLAALLSASVTASWNQAATFTVSHTLRQFQAGVVSPPTAVGETNRPYSILDPAPA